MARLFKRAFALTLETIRITDLDISFKVVRNLRREPNACEVAVYNLNADHRRQLAELRDVAVKLEVGYEDELSTIFVGDLRHVRTQREGPDFVTRVSSGDGEKRSRGARVNRSFGAGTTLATVVSHVAGALGVGLGNLPQAIAGRALEGGGALFRNGVTVSGRADDELHGLLESAGLEASVQSGALQVVERGRALAGTAVVLSPETGLIESPSEASDGVVSAKMLMIPDVFPGRRVEFRTREVSGFYRVEKAHYVGQTAGQDWGITIQAKGAP